MNWPAPQPGLVIRYAYLWQHQALVRQQEGTKDRPCAVVLAARDDNATERVYVLPITHAEPRPPQEGMEIPGPVKTRLRLDEERSWIIVTEGNVFTWPGPDLRPLAGHGPASVAYGFLPPRFFRVVRDRFVDCARARRAKLTVRDEWTR
ncbi:hypothetical protein FHP25_02350 [Vineibacter terrae]|uniref:Growth inhibitor PemK n=1 Tax=Vineibacter terrae TaxID=2586908 RepID=A0A5C8PUD2_9HYPH|nr:hypothetical protein FHP25_02350 [Vineibacter terrae]